MIIPSYLLPFLKRKHHRRFLDYSGIILHNHYIFITDTFLKALFVARSVQNFLSASISYQVQNRVLTPPIKVINVSIQHSIHVGITQLLRSSTCNIVLNVSN